MSRAVDMLSSLPNTARVPSFQRPTVRRDAGATPTATDVPSARPTSAPDFDMEALAVSCLPRGDFAMPIDLFIPVRTGASAVEIDHRDAFLLFHVDGASTIAVIAQQANLSLSDVAMSFHRLVAMGIVEMMESADSLRAPQSGVFYRATANTDEG